MEGGGKDYVGDYGIEGGLVVVVNKVWKGVYGNKIFNEVVLS